MNWWDSAAPVAEADNGEDAVQLARAHRPDVAILDLMMPRFGGIECAREILAAGAATGVVLLSVSSDEDVVIAALRAGYAATWSRPRRRPNWCAPFAK